MIKIAFYRVARFHVFVLIRLTVYLRYRRNFCLLNARFLVQPAEGKVKKEKSISLHPDEDYISFYPCTCTTGTATCHLDRTVQMEVSSVPLMPNDSDPGCPKESGFNKQNDNSVRS